MITPTEIRKKAEKKYLAFLQSVVEGKTFAPIVIVGNKKPDDDMVMFEKELTELMEHSKERKGYGYTIEYQTVKTKKHGLQDIPTSICFLTEYDYLRFIGKEQTTAHFRVDIGKCLSELPELLDWISKYPNKVLDNHNVWDDILVVCKYFKTTPKPQLYIRELPIQVHTKFIERNKGIIKELLDIIISEQVNTEATRFEPHFNLKYDEPIVRFRVLDENISEKCFSGTNDISLPISQFKSIGISVHTVYIVENKMNMLTFPLKSDSIVLWGHGFGVDILKNVEWLRSKRIFYWGDLDAHGFLILSELRKHFPQVESFLMDRETFDAFFENDKGVKTNVVGDLYLTSKEKEMFEYLKACNSRLEQEKIPFEYAKVKIPD